MLRKLFAILFTSAVLTASICGCTDSLANSTPVSSTNSITSNISGSTVTTQENTSALRPSSAPSDSIHSWKWFSRSYPRRWKDCFDCISKRLYPDGLPSVVCLHSWEKANRPTPAAWFPESLQSGEPLSHLNKPFWFSVSLQPALIRQCNPPLHQNRNYANSKVPLCGYRYPASERWLHSRAFLYMYSSSCPEPSGSPQGSFDRPALPTHRCAVNCFTSKNFSFNSSKVETFSHTFHILIVCPPNLQTFVPERSNSEKPEIQNLIFRTFREIKK